jgi:hypothetical protein
MILILYFLYLNTAVPIGAHNHPWTGKPLNWPGDDYHYYRAMLDSAVSCGLGYFKPGWLMRDWETIDLATKIASEYPLNQVFISYPVPPEYYADSAKWEGWWHTAANKYSGKGNNPIPGLVNPVKY